MEELSIYGVALVPLIIGMIELIKRVGVPKKYSPVVAIILGILFGFYYLAPGDPQKAVFLGLAAGLSAIGLYSGTKNTVQQLRNNNGKKNKVIKTGNWKKKGKDLVQPVKKERPRF
jgi:Kef-type K+ transport system membrane component KefB